MDTIKKESIDEFKEAILRDVELQKSIKKMFKTLLTLLVTAMIVLAVSTSIFLKQPSPKEKILLKYLEVEKKYLDKSREELLLIKKLALEQDSIRYAEYKLMTDAFKIIVDEEYINRARKNFK